MKREGMISPRYNSKYAMTLGQTECVCGGKGMEPWRRKELAVVLPTRTGIWRFEAGVGQETFSKKKQIFSVLWAIGSPSQLFNSAVLKTAATDCLKEWTWWDLAPWM